LCSELKPVERSLPDLIFVLVLTIVVVVVVIVLDPFLGISRYSITPSLQSPNRIDYEDDEEDQENERDSGQGHASPI
jgi:hypothetical protein